MREHTGAGCDLTNRGILGPYKGMVTRSLRDHVNTLGDLIGPRIVECLNRPFFAWNSCLKEKTAFPFNLHLLYVLLIQLHFVVFKGRRKGGPVPQELARSLTDRRSSCMGSTEGTVGLGPGNGRLNREYVIATYFQFPNLYRHSLSSPIFLCFKLIFIH